MTIIMSNIWSWSCSNYKLRRVRRVCIPQVSLQKETAWGKVQLALNEWNNILLSFFFTNPPKKWAMLCCRYLSFSFPPFTSMKWCTKEVKELIITPMKMRIYLTFLFSSPHKDEESKKKSKKSRRWDARRKRRE